MRLVLSLGELDVDRRKQSEDVRLDDCDEHLDGVDQDEQEHPEDGAGCHAHVGGGELLEHRLEEERGEHREGAHDHVAGKHVAEKTDGQSDEPRLLMEPQGPWALMPMTMK